MLFASDGKITSEKEVHALLACKTSVSQCAALEYITYMAHLLCIRYYLSTLFKNSELLITYRLSSRCFYSQLSLINCFASFFAILNVIKIMC